MGRSTLKITVDTNVLLRAALQDDPRQSSLASRILLNTDAVVVPTPALCEFVWVMRRLFQRSPSDIARSIRLLMDAANVDADRSAVEAGLEFLDQGGDFADGVIFYEGEWLGAGEFVSFDKQAVKLLKSQGKRARLLS